MLDNPRFQAPFEIYSFFSILLPKSVSLTGCNTKIRRLEVNWKPIGVLFLHTSFNAAYRYMLKNTTCLSAQSFRFKWFLLYTLYRYTVSPYFAIVFVQEWVKNKFVFCILSLFSPLVLSMLFSIEVPFYLVIRIDGIRSNASGSHFPKIMQSTSYVCNIPICIASLLTSFLFSSQRFFSKMARG